MKFSLQQLNWPNYFPSQDSISMIIHTFILAVNYLFKAFTHFCFHFDWNIISHNLNDQVCAIIIAHHKMDDQICAIERVDIYRQPLRKASHFLCFHPPQPLEATRSSFLFWAGQHSRLLSGGEERGVQMTRSRPGNSMKCKVGANVWEKHKTATRLLLACARLLQEIPGQFWGDPHWNKLGCKENYGWHRI